MVVPFCALNQWPKDWFEKAVNSAIDVAVSERKDDGLDGKAVDRDYVRSLVLETILAAAPAAGSA